MSVTALYKKLINQTTMSTINVHVVLDKSGSMCSVKEATMSGFNEYVDSLKKDKKNKYNVSLTLFDTEVEERYEAIPIKEVKELTDKNYDCGGCTALYDAACGTLSSARRNLGEKKTKSLVVILTDGDENSSKEYTQDQFKKMVEELSAKKNWTFVYLGANQDAWANAAKWGFSKDNVSTFHASAAGMKNTMRTLASNTMTYAGALDMQTQNFYSEKDKKKMESTK